MNNTLKGKLVTCVFRVEDEAAFHALKLYAENPPGLILIGVSCADLMRVRDDMAYELNRLRDLVCADDVASIDAVLAGQYDQPEPEEAKP